MRAFRPLLGFTAVLLLFPFTARAADPPSIKDRLRAALREAAEHLDEIGPIELQAIGQAQNKLGDRDRARATLRQAFQLDKSDNIPKELDEKSLGVVIWIDSNASLLAKIARSLAAAGDQSSSRAAFRRAVEVADRINTRPLPRKAVGDRTDTSSDVYMAREVLAMKIECLLKIATDQFQAGDRGFARETWGRVIDLAEGLKDDRQTIENLCKVARAQAKAGDREAVGATFDRAISLAEQLKDVLKFDARTDEIPPSGEAPAIRSPRHALSGVIVARLETGDIAGALRDLENTKVLGRFDVQNLRAIARAIPASDHDAADRLLGRLRGLATGFPREDETSRILGQEAIAQVEARLGRFDEANRVAQDVGRDSERPAIYAKIKARALLAIATAEIDAGDRPSARRRLRAAFQLIKDSEMAERPPFELPEPDYVDLPEDNLLEAMAQAQARAGDLDGASRTIEVLSMHEHENGKSGDPTNAAFAQTIRSRRIKVLAALAVAQAEVGDLEASRKSFRQALELVESVKNRDFFTKDIALAQARAGDPDAAIQTVGKIQFKLVAWIAINEVVSELLEAGSIQTARRVADAAGDEARNSALVKIAEAQAAAGDADEALRLATRIDDASYRAHALVGIVNGLEKRESKSKGPK